MFFIEDSIVVRERIKELVDFARNESPYRNANKGWINDDIYLQWGALPNQTEKEGNELLDIFIFWGPIKRLISILFLVFFLSSISVFAAVSFSQGKFTTSFVQTSLPTIQSEVKKNNQSQLTKEESVVDQIEIEPLAESPANEDESFLVNTIESPNSIPKEKPNNQLGTTAGNLF